MVTTRFIAVVVFTTLTAAVRAAPVQPVARGCTHSSHLPTYHCADAGPSPGSNFITAGPVGYTECIPDGTDKRDTILVAPPGFHVDEDTVGNDKRDTIMVAPPGFHVDTEDEEVKTETKRQGLNWKQILEAEPSS